ncbi:hypothetical protein DPMN_094146 [Dreissena polymorpha]|uniref:Uncharacterized protein n=1 Tax=Dreissena polymorpha TaxID=45954 RepID=A0A9D4L4K7_DREPO|nr:hypothetical protein DPMN_094146 [Dreissena polymorpha]
MVNAYLNRCGANIKSIWSCTCTFGAFGAYPVAVLDGLCGCSLLDSVRNSRSLSTLFMVFFMSNLPTVPDQSRKASGPTLAFQSLRTMRMPFFETWL